MAHGARAIERDERNQVFKFSRADFFERLTHALGLKLEHADRVSGGEHLEGLGVVERERVHVQTLAA